MTYHNRIFPLYRMGTCYAHGSAENSDDVQRLAQGEPALFAWAEADEALSAETCSLWSALTLGHCDGVDIRWSGHVQIYSRINNHWCGTFQHLRNLVGNNFPQFETLFQDCVNSWYPGLHGVHVHIHTYCVWCVRLSLCSWFQSAGPIAVQKAFVNCVRYLGYCAHGFFTAIGSALWNQLQRLNSKHQTWYVCMCTCTPCSPGYHEFTQSWNKVSNCGKLLPTRFCKCCNTCLYPS